MAPAFVPSSATRESPELLSFHTYLRQSTSIIALVGAGLSAPSGISTFKGNDGIWTAQSASSLATPDAFRADPRRVWQFYTHRRHAALQAQPNAAHFALAEASRHVRGMVTLSQNVDGLCERADHPPTQLVPLHGSLFAVQCTDRQDCGYCAQDFADLTGLAMTLSTAVETTSDPNVPDRDPVSEISELPACPQCKSLLRPGIVWYGERLDDTVLTRIRYCFSQPEGISIMLVIGTSAEVFPAAGYINVARMRGARLCVVNVDRHVRLHAELQDGDWFFEGDASVIVPMLLEPIVGAG